MSKAKFTLLIDQDDVLAEYIQAVTNAYNQKYGAQISVDACTSWNLSTIFGEEVDTIMHDPALFRELEPTKDALEVFERLYKSGLFEMYIVTAAHPACVEAKFEWIRKHLPFFPEDRVIVCKRKYMVKGDFLLDDGMHNIEAFLENGGTPIIFERPHNKNQRKDIKRVRDWLSFERIIMETCYPEQMAVEIEDEAI